MREERDEWLKRDRKKSHMREKSKRKLEEQGVVLKEMCV